MDLLYKIIRIIHHHKIQYTIIQIILHTYSTYVTYVHIFAKIYIILFYNYLKLYIDNSTHHYVELPQKGHIEV